MKICFIVDANSIHARRWIEYFCQPQHEIHVLSTTRSPEPMAGATVYELCSGKVVPSAKLLSPSSESRNGGRALDLARRTKAGRFTFRLASAIFEYPFIHRLVHLYRTFRLAGKARRLVHKLRPDLLHCLRLPIEGYVGGLVNYHPLVVTNWGNDIVYFARKFYLFRKLTNRTLHRTEAYMAETLRDKYIANIYGLSPLKNSLLIPGAGGLKLEKYPLYDRKDIRSKLGLVEDMNVIVSSRGFTVPYMNNEGLIRALPEILRCHPNTCAVMIGDTRSPGHLRFQRLAITLGIERNLRLLHWMDHSEFVKYLAAADIMASVSLYEGHSVSLLEAMALGVIPVVSNDLPQQEWVTEGWNGYLFDPMDSRSIAEEIIKALNDRDNFEVMRGRNRDLVREKGDYHKNMKRAEAFYKELVGRYVGRQSIVRESTHS